MYYNILGCITNTISELHGIAVTVMDFHPAKLIEIEMQHTCSHILYMHVSMCIY